MTVLRRIAFIGLGRMGGPMAANLLRAGFEVVGVDVDAGRREAFAAIGGRLAASPAEAAARCEASLSMLMNDAILREATLGPAGALAGAGPGHILCDLSTVSPAASADLARAAARKGVGSLCGRVAGSTGLAESAGLTLFASGEPALFARLEPAFSAMAASVRRVGAGEAAAYLKLVHSHIVGVYSAMIGEALAFGEKGGLSLELMIDVLEAGPLGSRQLTLKAPILKARRFASPPSDIDTAAKDVDLILDAGRADRTPLPLLAAARQLMAAAQAAGAGRRDIYSILETSERHAGLARGSDADGDENPH